MKTKNRKSGLHFLVSDGYAIHLDTCFLAWTQYRFYLLSNPYLKTPSDQNRTAIQLCTLQGTTLIHIRTIFPTRSNTCLWYLQNTICTTSKS
jgi:hypothetical protein